MPRSNAKWIARVVTLASALWSVSVPTAAHAQSTGTRCGVEQSIEGLRNRPSVMQWLQKTVSSEACGSLRQVLAVWGKGYKPGGRELQGGQPLNRAAAQAELEKAMRDPAFQREALPEIDREPSPVGRELLRAAWLHEFGHYQARDLVLDKLDRMGE